MCDGCGTHCILKQSSSMRIMNLDPKQNDPKLDDSGLNYVCPFIGTTQSKSASVAWSSSVSSLESQQYAPDQQWLPSK